MNQEEINRLLQPDEYYKQSQKLVSEVDEETASKLKEADKYPYTVRKIIKQVAEKYAHLHDNIPPYVPMTFLEDGPDEFIITRDGQVLSVDLYAHAESNGSANGYPRTRITYRSGVVKAYYRHRLLGQAYREYINNPEPDKPFENMVVNHIDGIKNHCYVTDLNGVKNIEVVTQKANTIHAYKNGLIKKNYNGQKDKRPQAVCCIDKDTNEIVQIFPSVNAAAREIGCPQPVITRALNNPQRNLTAGGFKWKRKKDIMRE